MSNQQTANAAGQGYLGSVTSAISNVTGKSELMANAASAAKAVTNSTYVTAASDTIRRNVGVDIRKALGGKSAVEIAEERLKQDLEKNASYGGYSGGYQGVQIPIDSNSGPSSSYSHNQSSRPSKSSYQPKQTYSEPVLQVRSSNQGGVKSHVGGMNWGQNQPQQE